MLKLGMRDAYPSTEVGGVANSAEAGARPSAEKEGARIGRGRQSRCMRVAGSVGRGNKYLGHRISKFPSAIHRFNCPYPCCDSVCSSDRLCGTIPIPHVLHTSPFDHTTPLQSSRLRETSLTPLYISPSTLHHARHNTHSRDHDPASAPRKGHPVPDVFPEAIIQDMVLVRAAARRGRESRTKRLARVWKAGEGFNAEREDVYVKWGQREVSLCCLG